MRTVLVLAVSLVALAGCGLRGDLVRPMPLWGDPPLDGLDDPRVIKAAEEAAAAEEARLDAERRAQREAAPTDVQTESEGADAPPPSPQ